MLVIPLDEKDAESITQIASLNYKKCYKIAMSYTKNRANAEDVVQKSFEGLIRVMHRLSKLSENELDRYLIRITYNVAKKTMKTYAKEEPIEDWDSIVDQAISVEEQLYRNYDQEIVRSTIEELSEQTKDYLILKYIFDYSNADISYIMGVPINQISMIRSRALKKAKKLINLKEGRECDADRRKF